MRGSDRQMGQLFSYLSPEAVVPEAHPLRVIRELENAALERLSPIFDEMYSSSEIPSFYIILHLALVWHDLLDPIIFFRQRGFHRAVTALAATGFVVFRIEDG